MKKKGKIALCLLAAVFLLTGCMSSNAAPLDESQIHFIQFDEIEEGRETVEITTSVGTIKMVLFPEEAPNTVAHFKKLVNEGFFTNMRIFAEADSHTIISGATDETGGQGKLVTEDEKPIKCETTPNLWHFSGAVSVLGYQEIRFSQD